MTGLFDDTYTQAPQAAEALVRMRERQLTLIEHGVHPLSGRADIHGRADLDASPLDPSDLPYRCGTCRFREVGRWPKCSAQHRDSTPETDVQPWWPACLLYEATA